MFTSKPETRGRFLAPLASKVVMGLGASIMILSGTSSVWAAKVADSQSCPITFSVSNATSANALELQVNSSPAAQAEGRFAASGGCTFPSGNGSASATASSLHTAWADNAVTFTGPGDFATCNFIAPGSTAPTLTPGDFSVAVLDCSVGTTIPAVCSPAPTMAVSVGPCVGVGAVCGNGVVEGSEECDGGAGCTTKCVQASAGCTTNPLGGCRTGLAGGAKILIKNNASDNAKDQGQYQWKKGAETVVGDFADPTTADVNKTYSWCLYDATGLIAGETVASGTGWTATGTTGFQFKSATAPSGVSQIKMKAGEQGKAQLSIKAKDKEGDYAAPATPFAAPVTSQFVIKNGPNKLCFETTFTNPAKNDAKQFNTKGP